MIKKYEFYDYFDKLDFVKVFDDCYYLADDKMFKSILDDILPYLTRDEQLFWIAFNSLFKGEIFNTYSIELDTYKLSWIRQDKYDDSNINALNNKIERVL